MRTRVLVRMAIVTCMVGALGVPSAVGAAQGSKYKACTLLTAAELEAAIKKKISKTDEGDVTIPDSL